MRTSKCFESHSESSSYISFCVYLKTTQQIKYGFLCVQPFRIIVNIYYLCVILFSFLLYILFNVTDPKTHCRNEIKRGTFFLIYNNKYLYIRCKL